MTTKRNPPIRCTPCRVIYDGLNYRIYENGSVSLSLLPADARRLGLTTIADHLAYERRNLDRYEPHSPIAKKIRQEAQRLRRNRNARERNQARRDLGMVKTPYGWE